MITAVIFDTDGVVVSSGRFSTSIVQDYGADPNKVKEFFAGPFQSCSIGKADLKEAVAPYLPHFGWKGTVDELLEYWFKSGSSLNEELITYIQMLRQSGIRAALATNQEKYRTQYMLDRMGFRDTFDAIYSSADLGVRKPAVEFFANVVAAMNVPRDNVLFWDDDQANIDGAVTYGIHAEFYSDYSSFLTTMSQKYNL